MFNHQKKNKLRGMNKQFFAGTGPDHKEGRNEHTARTKAAFGLIRATPFERENEMTTMDLQAVVDLTAEEFDHESMPIQIKDVIQGRAHIDSITLPEWMRKYAEAYQIYYAVHEMIHKIMSSGRHDSAFKLTENKALALWGIKIKRKTIYPKNIEMDGKKVTNLPPSCGRKK